MRALEVSLSGDSRLMQDLLAQLPDETLHGMIAFLADVERLTVDLLDDALAKLPSSSPIRARMGEQIAEERTHAKVMGDVAASLGDVHTEIAAPVTGHIRQLRAVLADTQGGAIDSLLRTIATYERFGAITYRWISEDPRLEPDLRRTLAQIADEESGHVGMYGNSEHSGPEAEAVRSVVSAVLDQVLLQGLDLHAAGAPIPDGILPGALGLFGQPVGGYAPITVRYDFEAAAPITATYANGGATLASPAQVPDVVVGVRAGEVGDHLRAMRMRRTTLVRAAIRSRARPMVLLRFLGWGWRLTRVIRETASAESR